MCVNAEKQLSLQNLRKICRGSNQRTHVIYKQCTMHFRLIGINHNTRDEKRGKTFVPIRQLCPNLMESDCVSFSLHSFFEDTKSLGPSTKILRSLLPPGCTRSTRQAFPMLCNGPNQGDGIIRVASESLKKTEVISYSLQ